MFGFLFLPDGYQASGWSLLGKHSLRHPVQFPARAFDLLLRLFLS
jgi:hypothetical protein